MGYTDDTLRSPGSKSSRGLHWPWIRSFPGAADLSAAKKIDISGVIRLPAGDKSPVPFLSAVPIAQAAGSGQSAVVRRQKRRKNSPLAFRLQLFALKISAAPIAQAEACASEKRRIFGGLAPTLVSLSLQLFALCFELLAFPVTPDSDPGSTAPPTFSDHSIRGFRPSPE